MVITRQCKIMHNGTVKGLSLTRQLCFHIFGRSYTQTQVHMNFPKQVFSAIQPSGEVHVGNYLSALKKWVELQNTGNNGIFSIADLHSLSLPQNPSMLNKNIHIMAATVLACGIDPDKSLFFKQSDVLQHAELCWYFSTISTMARLSHLPQFKEKTAAMKDTPVGLFLYPVLQVADIALYRATHIPVGKDQLQHIELANHLIRSFNKRFGETFPATQPLIDETIGSVKSLIEPEKKMSKSHLPKSRICLTDSPDQIRSKCKKAVTDCNSAITFDPEKRPGVSNLLLIHSHLTETPIDTICQQVNNLNTGDYKKLLADVIIEILKPIRENIERYMASPEYLESVLRSGAEKATEKAEITMRDVRNNLGLSLEQKLPINVRRKSSKGL